MFYIIESNHQIEELLQGEKTCYAEIIQEHDDYHPILTSPVALYIHPWNSKQGYILPIDHPEGLSLGEDRIYQVLRHFDSLYVMDRKQFLYHYICKGLKGINLLRTLSHKEIPKPPSYPRIFNQVYNKFRERSDINKLVPIVKLYERAYNNFLSIKDEVEELAPVEKLPAYSFYNEIATNVFFLCEQEGLGVEEESFIKHQTPANPSHSIKDGVVYTSYNLNNITSRPTNAFNSVNFAAIPHRSENRETILPKYNKFVEVDFDGYHLRLLGEVIGYTFSKESAHLQLAYLYFNKEHITEEEYAQAKQINFQSIYGSIPHKYRELEFFRKLQNFIDDTWAEYQTKGVIYAPISEKPFYNTLPNMNPQKLMNYIVQSLETSRNILVLQKILSYLRDKHTKLVLYTYDAMLFDYSEKDGPHLIEELKTIMSEEDSFPVKVKEGATYNL